MSSIMIIGAGPGIGQSVAERFGREGWSVVLSARSAETVAGLADALKGEGISAHAVAADATRPADLRAAIAESERLTGGLTAIHYNAALVRRQDLFSMSDDDISGDLAVNVGGALHAIRAATHLFATRGGTILVTGGGLAISPHRDYASLGLGKAALRNVVQGLAAPLAEAKIRIAIATVGALIAPGSDEARGVAETFWSLATDAEARWEATYPAP